MMKRTPEPDRRSSVPSWARVFYAGAYAAFSAAWLPHFLMRGRQASSFKELLSQRFGLLEGEWRGRLLGKKTVWIHAVSVGETLSLRVLLDRLLEAYPSCHFVITTVTPTGQELAKKMESERVSVCYAPFDFKTSVRRFYDALKPECVILTETEIWPNMLMEASERKIPAGIINARLSERSLSGYSRAGFLFRPLFENLEFVMAQTEEDAEKFRAMGVRPEKVRVTGNMKYDNVQLEPDVSPEEMRKTWGLEKEDLVLIAGSTHPGEEEPVFSVYEKLKEKMPRLKLILAPRHIERVEKLRKKLYRSGLVQGVTTENSKIGKLDVTYLNQMGILRDLYALADVVFVGGSLVPHGGQNPIEPASHRRAIVHGPYVFNFERVYKTLGEHGGTIFIRDVSELEFALVRLLERPSERDRLGENAYEAVSALRGATDRALEWFGEFLLREEQLAKG